MSNGVGLKWGARRAITLLLLLVGLVLFATLLWQIGLQTIVRSISNAGWYLPLVLLPQALLNTVHSSAWRVTFPKQYHAPSVTTLFRCNLAAKAIALVTPSISQSGELTRIHLLVLAGVSADLSTASVIGAKITIAIAEFLYIGIGLGVGISYLVVDPYLITSVFIGILALGVALLGVVIWQRSGLFRPLIWISRRFNIFTSVLDRHEDSLRSADRLIKEFVGSNGRFWSSCSLYFLFWAAGTVEVWLFTWVLGIPVDMVSAFLINVWLVTVIRLTMFVPANIGTYEAGAIMVFSVLGLSPESALAFALLSRLRQLFWAAVGFGILASVPGEHRLGLTAYSQRTASSIRGRLNKLVRKSRFRLRKQ